MNIRKLKSEIRKCRDCYSCNKQKPTVFKAHKKANILLICENSDEINSFDTGWWITSKSKCGDLNSNYCSNKFLKHEIDICNPLLIVIINSKLSTPYHKTPPNILIINEYNHENLKKIYDEYINLLQEDIEDVKELVNSAKHSIESAGQYVGL